MPRILIVDEDEARRSALAGTIRQLVECQIDLCATGAEARALLHPDSHDVIIVDIRRRHGPAPELCRELRAERCARDLPVLFVMPELAAAMALEAETDLGPVDFLIEPLVPGLLAARIQFALRLGAAAHRAGGGGERRELRRPEPGAAAEAYANEVRAERDTLRETFEAFEEAVVLLASSGRVVVANAAGYRAMSSSLKGDLLSWSAGVSLPASPRGREFHEGGRILLGYAYPLSGHRVLVSLRDVTLDRENEVRRLQAEKLASIGMLAAGVAHEINNPAAFIIGNFDAVSAQLRELDQRIGLVADGELKTKMGEILFETAAILQESKEGMARIHRIARDLSSFAHVDDDLVGLTEINSAVDSTLGILRNELRHRASVDRDLQATRLVRATSARLGQVFLNLIMNAAQAVDETQARDNRIRVRTYDRGNDVIFEVTDNGTGIAPAVLPRVFDSFFTTKARGIGTGLGLPISQGIVNSLGGDITVETQIGRGTRFRVRLPSEPAVRIEPPVPSGDVTQDYRRRRVLAVDDEALLLKAYRRMIGDVHEVVTALGGRDALLILRKRQDFDVILCDLQMPEMSGIELFMTAKRDFPALASRFVFVTGGAFSTEARQFLEQAVTCLNKPFSIDELMALIEAKGGLGEPAGGEAVPEADPRRGPWAPRPADEGRGAAPSADPHAFTAGDPRPQGE